LGNAHGVHVTPAHVTARRPALHRHCLLSGEHVLLAGQYPPSAQSTTPPPQKTGAQ